MIKIKEYHHGNLYRTLPRISWHMRELIRTSKNIYLNSVVSVEVQDTSSEEVVGSTPQPV